MHDVSVAIADGTRLSVHHWPGADPVFVLVHGLASNARVWDATARHLAEAGHGVVSYDQRGHGRSDRPSDGYDLATAISDLEVVLETTGVVRPVLAGQSWGGNLVVAYAARSARPVSAIAGIDGGMIELSDSFATWEACAAALRPPEPRAPLDEIRRWMRQSRPDWPVEGIEATLANLETGPDGLARNRLPLQAHMSIVRTMWDNPPQADLAATSIPALFVFAEHEGERADAARETARRHHRPGVRVEWMEGDHDLHAQHPAAVAAHLASLA